MSGAHPPLSCKDVENILKKLDFNPRPQKGTSHVHWVRTKDGKFNKVTVDCPKAPFSQDLIKSMAKQAGLSKNDFYALHKK